MNLMWCVVQVFKWLLCQHICSEGSIVCMHFVEQECSDGYYTSTSGQASCDVCPEGFYCLPVTPSNASLNAQSCPAGYYCPQGKGSLHVSLLVFVLMQSCLWRGTGKD